MEQSPFRHYWIDALWAQYHQAIRENYNLDNITAILRGAGASDDELRDAYVLATLKSDDSGVIFNVTVGDCTQTVEL
jgi:hypothetical protein